MADRITVKYRFSCGDVVHYNHGGERFTIEAQRHTRNPCTVDRIEYLLSTPAGHFWAREAELTLAKGLAPQ
jgi:hypothetical protein